MKKHLLAATLMLFLAGCGFQLRSSNPALYPPLPYQSWAVEGGVMQQALENALSRRNAQINAAFGEGMIKVLNVESHKDIQTVNLSGTVNEYLLVLNVTVEASHNGKALSTPFTVSARRPMDYRDKDILGKQEEEAQLWAQMRADVARQIVRRLGYLKAQ